VQKEFPEAEVFSIKEIKLKSPIVFAGFVGAGLVGPLAINHIITKLKMTEIAVMRSKISSTINSFHERKITSSF
jgi:Archaeal enzymes of ATP-grasp superfamily